MKNKNNILIYLAIFQIAFDAIVLSFLLYPVQKVDKTSRDVSGMLTEMSITLADIQESRHQQLFDLAMNRASCDRISEALKEMAARCEEEGDKKMAAVLRTRSNSIISANQQR